MTDAHIPLMPKATAVWLVKHTSLTFQQIAVFCGLHEIEVQGIADGEVMQNVVGIDPVSVGQLSREMIKKCEEDSSARLELSNDYSELNFINKKSRKSAKYTPMVLRRSKPDCILWLLKHYPDISNKQIIKLLGTTKNTIELIKNKMHWNSSGLRPQDPVMLGICKQSELDAVVAELDVSKYTDGASRFTTNQGS